MNPSLFAAIALATIGLVGSARAQTTLFAENFENGLGQWSVSGLWHLQPPTGNCMGELESSLPGGGMSAAFNNFHTSIGFCGFPTAAAGNLTTVLPISIPASASSARLRFKSYEATECSYGNCGWDDRYVQVSVDAGQTWVNVAFGATERVWYERVVSLDSYRGLDLLLQFRFEPVDSLWNDFPGWFVDDVVVEVDSPFTLYCTGKIGSHDCIPYVSAAGDTSLSGADDLVISGHLLRNNVYSKLIWSRGSNNAPFAGGTLCVMSPAARTTVTSSGGTAAPIIDCSGSYSFAFTHAYMASKNVLAGQTLYVQASTRDPGYASPWNHGLSNALSFLVLP